MSIRRLQVLFIIRRRFYWCSGHWILIRLAICEESRDIVRKIQILYFFIFVMYISYASSVFWMPHMFTRQSWCDRLSSMGHNFTIRRFFRNLARRLGNHFFWNQIVSKWSILDSDSNDFRRRFDCIHPRFWFGALMGDIRHDFCQNLTIFEKNYFSKSSCMKSRGVRYYPGDS